MWISVHTEITDEQAGPSGPAPSRPCAAETSSRGWIFYDGECEFCRNWVRRTEPMLGPRGFTFAPLQASWVRALLQLREEELLREMRVLLDTGESFGGADAIIEIAKCVWWTWPLAALARIPRMRGALRAAYRQIAARRSCLAAACSTRPELSVQMHPPGEGGSVTP